MISLADVPRGRSGSWITPQMLAFAAIMGTAPFWLGPVGLYQYLGVEVLIWIIYAVGFNLLFGYAGLHSFGHGAYYGIGVYAFGLFQHNVVVSLWGGLGAAILAAALAGSIVGAIVCHRRGIYFALMTIAFGQIFWFSSIKLHGLTGGEDGLLNIPRPPADFGLVSFDLTSNTAFYWFVFAALLLVIVRITPRPRASTGRCLIDPSGRVVERCAYMVGRCGQHDADPAGGRLPV